MDNNMSGDHMPSPPSIQLFCQMCGKEFFVYPYRKAIAKFCSRSCGSKKAGANNNRWRGGRSVMKNGYVRVRVNGDYVYEHRYVMERSMGRKLKCTEVVHHINGDRTDNRINNLKIMDKASHDARETKRRWSDGIFIMTSQRCGKPRIDRHGKGKYCRRFNPCHYHP